MRISDFFCYFAPLFAISGKTKWLITLHINNLTNEISNIKINEVINIFNRNQTFNNKIKSEACEKVDVSYDKYGVLDKITEKLKNNKMILKQYLLDGLKKNIKSDEKLINNLSNFLSDNLKSDTELLLNKFVINKSKIILSEESIKKIIIMNDKFYQEIIDKELNEILSDNIISLIKMKSYLKMESFV